MGLGELNGFAPYNIQILQNHQSTNESSPNFIGCTITSLSFPLQQQQQNNEQHVIYNASQVHRSNFSWMIPIRVTSTLMNPSKFHYVGEREYEFSLILFPTIKGRIWLVPRGIVICMGSILLVFYSNRSFLVLCPTRVRENWICKINVVNTTIFKTVVRAIKILNI